MPPGQFISEIREQPAALQRVIDAYTGKAGRARWAALPQAGARPVLVGMGASYHAARLGAHWLAARGLMATAHEASELLYQERSPLEHATALIYLSQSGASGEVVPVLDRLAPGTPVIALTNDEQSPVAERAGGVLPLLAGDEQTVATKTYTNCLALLWLLAAHAAGEAAAVPEAEAALTTVQRHLTALAREGEAAGQWWVERLGLAQPLVFLGAGPSAVTARQCAMMVMEWLKTPALSATPGAFRHGPLEIAAAGLGVVVFAPPTPARASLLRLAEELAGYGVTVVAVEYGRGRALDEAPVAPPRLDPALAPLVDGVPVQYFVEALARARGLPGEFRRISKVVKQV